MANRKIGSLWAGKDKNGKTYLNGNLDVDLLNTVRIVVFQNNKKEAGSKQPDYIVYLSQDDREESKGNDALADPLNAGLDTAEPEIQATEDNINVDNIPF